MIAKIMGGVAVAALLGCGGLYFSLQSAKETIKQKDTMIGILETEKSVLEANLTTANDRIDAINETNTILRAHNKRISNELRKANAVAEAIKDRDDERLEELGVSNSVRDTISILRRLCNPEGDNQGTSDSSSD